METSLPIAFTVGLFSALHCLGMCGGIMGALSFGLPPERREHTPHLLAFLLAYNLGRILSYTLAGGLMAGLSSSLMQATAGSGGHRILQWAAGVILISIGLHIAGWFPRLALVERLGVPLWHRLEPLSHRLLPVRTPTRALFYGAVWGWLPCGLVYTMLLGSATRADPLSGALYMAAFGLGTLPALFTAGLLAGRLYGLARDPWLRTAVGLSLVLFGLVGIWFPESGLMR